MSADAETAHAYRGMIARAVQRSSNDNGGSQTANVEVHRHIVPVSRSSRRLASPRARPPAAR